MSEESLWYKDAVIYQMHVKAFQDANGDGIGDFAGLTQRLDYIQDLGVDTLWLLPFYPSPLRDDGYDIADYCDVHPDYGTLEDFKEFIAAAHRRGLKIITELVINHTSDQHPWFQLARRSPPGSAERDFYVWSDDDKKFAGTRIIFTDTEASNWAWDSLAGQYYWHRFFSHQPDLNHNNPRVVDAVIEVMRFWMNMGVDGMRLDAIPYLCVREGTSNENLPETHAVLKRMRAAMDASYRDRVFLAEANQWPEDVREYFGDGDECHMAYHFPLMPRIFMAVALEDRYPISEILRQTPDIPENCQWAIFLRNHDELTLEMVTDRERDYMYQMYAQEPRMRVNVGIRRRLAPLLGNDTDRIKLMNSLLLSMPGSPVIYYGDEIGMGDNIYIGDRDGVRTPMQWSIDRNAGFSRADPQRLYLPTIMDPIYGYQAVNVEAQNRDPSSLLNWTRRILAVRRQYQCFGRGTLDFVRPQNRKLIAYIRSFDAEIVLCVANLAQTAQAVELDLSKYKGRVPVELMGHNAFPPIGELPYFLTLPAHGFFWLLLSDTAQPPEWHVERLPATELPVLVLAEGLTTFLVDGARAPSGSGLARRTVQQLEQDVLPEFLQPRCWFRRSREGFVAAQLGPRSLWRMDQKTFLLSFIEAKSAEEPQRYFLPLTIAWEDDTDGVLRTSDWTLAKVREHARAGVLIDAYADPTFCLGLVRCATENARVPFAGGELHFERCGNQLSLPPEAEVQALDHAGTVVDHTSIVLHNALFLKAYRRVEIGPHPDVEMGRFLTRAGFRSSAALCASITYVDTDSTVIAAVFAYIGNQGDAWTYALNHLDRYATDMYSQDVAVESPHALFTRQMRTLGRRVGALHALLARAPADDAAFAPEPYEITDLERLCDAICRDARSVLESLSDKMPALTPALRISAERLLTQRRTLLQCICEMGSVTGGEPLQRFRTRLHGNLRLSKVLLVADDLLITGFEGDPTLTLAQRRRKATPLYDVASLLRSFDHARATALERAVTGRPDLSEHLEAALLQWREAASEAFLKGYRASMRGVGSVPADKASFMRQLNLLQIGLVTRELLELLSSDPGRIAAPIDALLELMNKRAGRRIGRQDHR
ncbi:maltose alpha-D-glucosyltransferase/ alpha-amylase [Steroidobacter denitrificans]|uniref:maltose alpha-D-glucosyltransferase n=1 Tax=Steroidobacter denitrificans TaxID=465721 RepID=A0A127F7Z9_STEDE|nr:maltose alpha-D-glucosyltransferase [Steroidobacter denitrificans]AMN45680.1 maltose alpha-D-glucosyltransferase/ alpha-amylase [Steroidobacter denitrificans]